MNQLMTHRLTLKRIQKKRRQNMKKSSSRSRKLHILQKKLENLQKIEPVDQIMIELLKLQINDLEIDTLFYDMKAMFAWIELEELMIAYIC